MIFTQSSQRTFRACPTKYLFTYDKLRRPLRQPLPLTIGSIWHGIRDAYWTHGFEAAFARVTYDEMALDHIEWVKLHAMLFGYHARWADWLNEIDVIDVERPFAVTINGYQVAGAFDSVIRENGELWVVEEKTSAGTSDLYYRRLEIDPQCSTYYEAALQTYGEYPAGILYMVNQKTKLTPLMRAENVKYKLCKVKGCDGALNCEHDREPYANQRLTNESVDEYFHRILADIASAPDKYYAKTPVMRLAMQIHEAKRIIQTTAEDIIIATRKNRWPQNPDSCISNYGTCPFFDVCTGRASIADNTLFRTAKVPHEELERKE